jgi:hypothetical protein
VVTTLVLTATVAFGGACAARPEPGDMARQALERRGIEGVEVGFEPDTRMVRLRGLVATDEVRQNAEASVRAVVGRMATVSNEVLVEGGRAGAMERQPGTHAPGRPAPSSGQP